jgi:hypothetical protein
MDYTIKIITRCQVPSDIYLCGENDNTDFRYIHLFEFNNGFKIVYGSYNCIYNVTDIIEDIENDFRITTEYNKDPGELQEYYKDEFDIHYKYKICEKIWNHYNNNKQLIQDIIDYYKDSEDEDSIIDEGIDSDY